MDAKEMFWIDSAIVYPLVILIKVLRITAFTHYPDLFSYFFSPYFTN